MKLDEFKTQFEIIHHQSQVKYYERQIEDLKHLIKVRNKLIKKLKTKEKI